MISKSRFELIKKSLKSYLFLIFSASIVASSVAHPQQVPADVAWMAPAKFGVSHHFLAGDANNFYKIQAYDDWNGYINDFDVDAYADTVEKIGVGYVIFTLTQNRGYLATSSAVYDANSPPCPANRVGCQSQAGDPSRADYTPERDLVLDLSIALQAKGIKLIVYLPSHVGNNWTGSIVLPESFADWWVSDFITERAQAWGTNVAGWWFDGYWLIRQQEQLNDFPILTKIHTSVTSGQPNPVLAFNNGVAPAGDPYNTHDKFSNYASGEQDVLSPVPASGSFVGYAGNVAQSHTWTYISDFWADLDSNLRFSDQQVANRALQISNIGAVSSWDVTINPDGTWPVDRIKQMQVVGNRLGTTTDTTYSSLTIVNNDNSNMEYSSGGAWSHLQNRGTGDFNQDVHRTMIDEAFVTYDFTGTSIVYATSKYVDQGDVEIFIDDVSQGIFSTNDARNTRQVQEIIFERHDLADTEHTLRVVKKSGTYMVVDLVLSKTPETPIGASSLAFNKPASQSSTFPNIGGEAFNAVDGITSGNYGDGSTTHTLAESAAWWRVDLESDNSIGEIAVHNRTDCCSERLSNYTVSVLDNNLAVVWSSVQTSAPDPVTTVDADGAVGRYVQVQLNGSGFLSLAEVEVFPQYLSTGKTATQSSTLAGVTGAASNAVDGNTSGDFNDGSTTHTASEPGAWWQVDLASDESIGEIAVYNRTDCCSERLSNYTVSVLDSNFSTVWSSTQTSSPNPVTTVDAGGVVGRYVQVQLVGTNFLSLAEVLVSAGSGPSTPQLLSGGKPATQSTTAYDGSASLAVDGNTSGDYFNDNSTTHTFQETAPWWRVDLETDNAVGDISVYNRTDCCSDRLSNYTVSVLDSNLNVVWSSTETSSPNPVTTVDAAGAVGRYVQVQLNGTNFLSLAEVEVFSDD